MDNYAKCYNPPSKCEFNVFNHGEIHIRNEKFNSNAKSPVSKNYLCDLI